MAIEKMVRVSSKGQIVLPKRLRDKMGISEGDYLTVHMLSSGAIVLAKPSNTTFDDLAEPFRRAAKAQGLTREQLMDTIKEIRAQRSSDAQGLID